MAGYVNLPQIPLQINADIVQNVSMFAATYPDRMKPSMSGRNMNILQQLLHHDFWTTLQLIDRCAKLSDSELDKEFNIGHQTIRATVNHMVRNVDVWSAVISDTDISSPLQQTPGPTIKSLRMRLCGAFEQLRATALRVENDGRWNEEFIDPVDGKTKQRGLAISHIITHSMHHRAQLLYMMRCVGLSDLPEGDVFSWHAATVAKNNNID